MTSTELAIEEDGDLLTLSGLLTIEHGRKLRARDGPAGGSTNVRGEQR